MVVKLSESFLGSSSGKSSPRKLYQRSFSVENPGEMTSSQSFTVQVETSPAIEKHFLRPQSSGYSPHSCLSFSRIFHFERSSFSLMPKCLETQEYQERDRFHLCSLDCHQALHPEAGRLLILTAQWGYGGWSLSTHIFPRSSPSLSPTLCLSRIISQPEEAEEEYLNCLVSFHLHQNLNFSFPGWKGGAQQ